MDQLAPATLLSSIQYFQKHKYLSQHVVHPFANSAEETCDELQELIQRADQLFDSLNFYTTSSWTSSRLVSLLHQHATQEQELNAPEKTIDHLVASLLESSGTTYGEDIPLDPAAIVDWCIAQLLSWGISAGMETFRDDRLGGATVMLGGKVLVIDVDFTYRQVNDLSSALEVSNVKTSYAVTNNLPPLNTNGSKLLDTFLKENIQSYCTEVQKPDDIRDTQDASRLKKDILKQLHYLVVLDKLAGKQDVGGIRWFAEVDVLSSTLECYAKKEAEVVASALSTTDAPLDVFLLRSHALPLPYLISPSVSFLVYLSPLAYLSLLRSSPSQPGDNDRASPSIDIPLWKTRKYLKNGDKGATIATLTLVKLSVGQLFPESMSMPTLTSRPTFPLVPSGSQIDHVFPIDSGVSNDLVTLSDQLHWNLDFTNGGKTPGVVISQTRMRDIELVINPLGGIDNMGSVNMLSFGTGSWVDLLLKSSATISSERYTALYRSPSSRHPPLHLRLTPPEEPGFLLERVPVHNMKEVWGVLEIVREQCWLNEILKGCDWTTDDLDTNEDRLLEDSEATEDELHAVLSGTSVPRKIPVTIFLPSHDDSTESLFGTDLDSMSISQSRRPKIIMTSPERPPMSGLVEIHVSYDETKPKGVTIEVRGAMGADIKLDVFEEASRRGGTLGLPGRVWASAHSLSM